MMSRVALSRASTSRRSGARRLYARRRGHDRCRDVEPDREGASIGRAQADRGRVRAFIASRAREYQSAVWMSNAPAHTETESAHLKGDDVLSPQTDARGSAQDRTGGRQWATPRVKGRHEEGKRKRDFAATRPRAPRRGVQGRLHLCRLKRPANAAGSTSE